VYITTFYSFKGGVGRTLALVNVAIELARAGRKVLLVDFDLEAPGLTTFDALKPAESHPGIVEFVTDFRDTLTAPDVTRYVYEAPNIGAQGGRLWLMPAGRGDTTYQALLASINWQQLYRELDGYLLFEDLKEQWRRVYNPDYVFIDSRTGHTDIEGICTRQLPDAVAVLFFPNEQNLAGLRQVVADIRAEVEPPRRKKILLHFVMSNVPDLDDEDEILPRRMEAFETALGYEALTATVHRYESLALLNQVIFTLARPKSRLAKEYRQIKDAIVINNIEDREGAVLFLKQSYRPWGFEFNLGKEEVNQRLLQIIEHHPDDTELLFLVAMVHKSERRLEDALALLDKALQRNNRMGQFLIERAGIRYELNEPVGAISDLQDALALPELGVSNAERAIRLLRRLGQDQLPLVPDTPAIQSLGAEDRAYIGGLLSSDRVTLAASARLLEQALQDPELPTEERSAVSHGYSLCLIGLGRFSEALAVIAGQYPAFDDLPLSWAFNYAMAEWGALGAPSPESFRRVLTRAEDLRELPRHDEANLYQCLAVANWVVDHITAAQECLDRAAERARQSKKPAFSCWRYYEVPPEEFLNDCGCIQRLLNGETLLPFFIEQAARRSAG
jgi:MinD-like ATPase involved in chromosome partitioning or flagellar assembly